MSMPAPMVRAGRTDASSRNLFQLLAVCSLNHVTRGDDLLDEVLILGTSRTHVLNLAEADAAPFLDGSLHAQALVKGCNDLNTNSPVATVARRALAMVVLVGRH